MDPWVTPSLTVTALGRVFPSPYPQMGHSNPPKHVSKRIGYPAKQRGDCLSICSREREDVRVGQRRRRPAVPERQAARRAGQYTAASSAEPAPDESAPVPDWSEDP